jgi:hypothetical protein
MNLATSVSVIFDLRCKEIDKVTTSKEAGALTSWNPLTSSCKT